MGFKSFTWFLLFPSRNCIAELGSLRTFSPSCCHFPFETWPSPAASICWLLSFSHWVILVMVHLEDIHVHSFVCPPLHSVRGCQTPWQWELQAVVRHQNGCWELNSGMVPVLSHVCSPRTLTFLSFGDPEGLIPARWVPYHWALPGTFPSMTAYPACLLILALP